MCVFLSVLDNNTYAVRISAGLILVVHGKKSVIDEEMKKRREVKKNGNIHGC